MNTQAGRDANFQQLFDHCVGEVGFGGDMKFVDYFFSFLRRKTDLIDTQHGADDVASLLNKHAKAKRLARKKARKAAASAPAARTKPVPVLPESKVEEVLSDDEQPTQEQPEEAKGAKPVGNGGTTDRYTWTQTLRELTVNVKVPDGVSARNLNIAFSPDHLVLGVKGQTPIIDGDLVHRIHVDQSTWTLEDGIVTLEMSKLDRMNWWDTVIQGDPTIDTKAIEPENSRLDDLDRDTRSTVEKMMFDQRQKQRGLPTSEEQKKQEAIRKFMAMHPEMDFSQAKIN